VKASYLLPALLPLSYALCVGIGAVGGRARDALRLTLLSIAVLATAITWDGWWP
jgi:hypothetical protein